MWLKELSRLYAMYEPLQAVYKESLSRKGFLKMKYEKVYKDSLSKYPELKERMQRLSVITERTSSVNFRIRADSRGDNKVRLSGEKKFNGNFIVKGSIFLYN